MKQPINGPWQRKVMDYIRERGIVRPTDAEAAGIPREYLLRLMKSGKIERIGRGLYSLPGASTSEYRQFAEVSRRVPRGIICLLSALQFHELTTQLPHEVWVALPAPGYCPRIDYPAIHVVWHAKRCHDFGSEEHLIDKVAVRIYGVARTVADCFRFRNKTGLDVALEALRECRRKKRTTMDELWQAARVCRVAEVMRPYLESVA